MVCWRRHCYLRCYQCVSLHEVSGRCHQVMWGADSLTSSDPGTGETIGSLPDMGLSDTIQAINHAEEAFKTWSKTTEYERAAILNKMFK